MSTSDPLLERARAWITEDPDPETRAELSALIEAGDMEALEARFAGRLAFGTAGLRAPLGAGPTRMNRLVVRQTAAGLCRHLGEAPTVVIGYDARHKSDDFAVDTARVVAGAGGRAWVLPRPLPTPVLAFAVRHLGVDAGVMVTASHNPPEDNGYKVYLGDGAQLVPPADREIAALHRRGGHGPCPARRGRRRRHHLARRRGRRRLSAGGAVAGAGPRRPRCRHRLHRHARRGP